MSERKTTTLALEVLDRVLRTWWLVVLGVALGLFMASVALRFLPKTYWASTQIFVAPSRLPLEFVRQQDTGDMAMRVASLRESVLSRPYLVKIAADVYEKTDDVAERERFLDVIRYRLDASVIRIDTARGSGVFELSYRDSDPQRAANVANMLANLFIEENVKIRTSQASTTSSVLTGLADEIKKQLEERERAIAEFKRQHLYELGTQQESNVQLLAARQHDLENAQRMLLDEQNRLELLLAQRAIARERTGVAGSREAADTPAARLARSKAELAQLQQNFKDEHPAVKAKKREIAGLEAALGAGSGGLEGAVGPPALTDTLDAQVAAAERQVERLQQEIIQTRQEIQIYQARVERTPRVEQQLAELTKGYDVLLERYNSYQTSVENARGAEMVEQARQGEQFQVIEKAIPPTVPVSPAPLTVLPVALLLGLGASVGPLVASTLLRPRIRSRRGLAEISPVPLMTSIERMETPQVIKERWLHGFWAAGSVVLSVALLAVAALIW